VRRAHSRGARQRSPIEARKRSSAPWRMYAAAILSTSFGRRRREASASSRVRVTAAVERRSSTSTTGHVDWAVNCGRRRGPIGRAGPSDAFMLSGKPTMSPPMPCSEMSAAQSSRVAWNFAALEAS
jgi:hypothetical protein